MSNNKVEPVELNDYCYIAANDEAENSSYIVHFTSVPYTLQGDME